MTSQPPAVAPGQPAAEPTTKPRPSAGARRFGYAVAIAVNLVLIYLLYVEPGWRVVPFLTEDAAAVIAVVVASMVISIAVNLVWVVVDPLWLRSLGEAVTSAVGIFVLSRILQVFPFTFAGDDPWDVLARIVLIVGLVGTAIGVVVNLVAFVRRLVAPPEDARDNGAGGHT